MRPRTYARPNLERLAPDDPAFESGGNWYPYPDNEPMTDTRFGQYTNLHYDLHEIGAQISSLLFHSNGREYGQEDRLNHLDKRLQSFSQQLPSLGEGSPLNPHTMELKQVDPTGKRTVLTCTASYTTGSESHSSALQSCQIRRSCRQFRASAFMIKLNKNAFGQAW